MDKEMTDPRPEKPDILPTPASLPDRKQMHLKVLWNKPQITEQIVVQPGQEDSVSFSPVSDFLGAGDICLVFKGKTGTGHETAVKTLFPTQVADTTLAKELFTKEAELIRSSTHPHLPIFYGSGEIPLTPTTRIPFFARELFSDFSLSQFVSGLPDSEKPAEISRLIIQISSALEYLHREKQIITTDIHPGNIFRRQDGSYVLTDLGLTVNSETGAGQAGYNVGYSPPEFDHLDLTSSSDLKNFATPRAQVYSLAAITWELLGGKLATREDYAFGGSVNPDSLPQSVPPDTRKVLLNALTPLSSVPSPENHSQSCSQFALDLQNSLQP